MVLNTGGGNKGKLVARKFVKQSGAGSAGTKTVRVVQDEGEMYAVVSKLFGNCMCKVMCYDGYNRLCIIRKKFTGRRKTDNIVSAGSVLLVGLQSYGAIKPAASVNSSSNKSDNHLPRCDLLYVYTDQEKEKLRKVCDISKMNAALGGGGDTSGAASSQQQQQDDDTIKFVTSGTGVFNKYANQEMRKGAVAIGSDANNNGGNGGNGSNGSNNNNNKLIDSGAWLNGMISDDDDYDDDDDERGDMRPPSDPLCADDSERGEMRPLRSASNPSLKEGVRGALVAPCSDDSDDDSERGDMRPLRSASNPSLKEGVRGALVAPRVAPRVINIDDI
jgi:translation initiation factor IF-1